MCEPGIGGGRCYLAAKSGLGDLALDPHKIKLKLFSIEITREPA